MDFFTGGSVIMDYGPETFNHEASDTRFLCNTGATEKYVSTQIFAKLQKCTYTYTSLQLPAEIKASAVKWQQLWFLYIVVKDTITIMIMGQIMD